jgi:hypothetical protein
MPISPPFINSSQLVDEMIPQSRFICNNVLIHSFKHTTIRLIGLLFLAFGSFIIMVFCSSEKIFSAWPRRRMNSATRQTLDTWIDSSWESNIFVEADATGGQGETTAYSENEPLVASHSNDAVAEQGDSEAYQLQELQRVQVEGEGQEAGLGDNSE